MVFRTSVKDPPHFPGRIAIAILGVLVLLFPLAACSPKRYAAGKLADALAGQGRSVGTDDDPDLVRDAAPFQLKLQEGLLETVPNHRGLLLATCSGFAQYAFAFVQQDADEAEAVDVEKARALRERARRLYLRATRYGLRGLQAGRPGFASRLASDPGAAAAECGLPDAALLYWTAASWLSAIALSKDRPETVADLPQPMALARRALEVDESFGKGALQTLWITLAMTRPGSAARNALEAREHFDRAVALSGGASAGPFVTLAEAVEVPLQDRAAFVAALRRALAIDADGHPENRLETLVMQRRARWLLARADELFAD